MKKIGFVDYYLGEWHANNYPQWFREASEKLGLDYVVAYAWAEKDVSPVNNVTTEQWCREQNVTQCETLEELCEKSDVIVVLAPSDPDKHLGYAETVLSYGKRTYIDKTFAPDAATAAKIFALGEKYHTPFFSTSALRYASELAECDGAQNLTITGGGSNFAEYVIHQAEMAVVLLGDSAKAVRVETMGKQRLCLCRGDRDVFLTFAPSLWFSVTAELPSGRVLSRKIVSDYFKVLIEKILLFFENGEQPFDPQETMAVMRLREALLKAEQQSGEWIEV